MAPQRPQGPPEPPSTKDLQSVERIELYRKLSSIADLDALHSVIAAQGAQILDKGLPYVLIAARNWRRSIHRRSAAHPEVPITDQPEPQSIWNPLDQLEQKESLRSLTSAISQLNDQDVLVVWRHAEGYTDLQIQQEWDTLGFEPRTPSEEYLRKRRQRAREHLRTLLAT